MREIKYTARFKQDYRREKSGQRGKKLDALLVEIVNLLANDTPLPAGLLTTLLELVRLGSHSELGF